jgi:hypothetical protein
MCLWKQCPIFSGKISRITSFFGNNVQLSNYYRFLHVIFISMTFPCFPEMYKPWKQRPICLMKQCRICFRKQCPIYSGKISNCNLFLEAMSNFLRKISRISIWKQCPIFSGKISRMTNYFRKHCPIVLKKKFSNYNSLLDYYSVLYTF